MYVMYEMCALKNTEVVGTCKMIKIRKITMKLLHSVLESAAFIYNLITYRFNE